MAMRLQEVHPSLVHFPLTLLPLTVGADMIGRFTGNQRLLWLGRWGIAATAITGGAAGIAGLIAQEEVNLSGKALDLLVTHRTLNLAVVAAAGAMAVLRARRKKPSIGYLIGGLAALGAMAYSGYIGGEMVYRHGVGVEPAGGLWKGGGPELKIRDTGHVAATAGKDFGKGVASLAKDVAGGRIMPTLTVGPSQPPGGGTGTTGTTQQGMQGA